MVRTFVLVFGTLYTLIGVMGFIPGLVQEPAVNAPNLIVTVGYGYFLGWFPINVVHNILHLGVGLLGTVAYRSYEAAQSYSRAVAGLFAVLAVMGLLPVLQTAFGLAPLFSHDIWLHTVSAALAGLFGYVIPAPEPEQAET